MYHGIQASPTLIAPFCVAADMQLMTGDHPVDPDAQATINDFLDYTEYLPSDLLRSLTLIGKLDESYLAAAGTVHDLSKEYGSLPSKSPIKKPSSQKLRNQISYNLDYAVSSRESSYGEASRLYEMVDRHYNRLTSITSKLHALPKPPSRDPTPVPRSPQATRQTITPRITLRLDGARAAESAGRASGQPHKSRYRSRRITVPGEVLPPPNPDSPLPLTDSEWESVPPSPIPMPTSRVGGSRPRSGKPARIRAPKPPRAPKISGPKVPRAPRPPGVMGTNVHSVVAGISTSNALSLIPPPPPDAKPGSEHAPWMRLTEYEMAKLRKRMKKNAIWTPSETMIRRELADAGRGPDNYRSTKAKAEATGEEFLDDDNIATTAPGKPLAPGEISTDSLGLVETNLSNRGMKLNEAKKIKREAMLAASLLETQQVANRLSELGNGFKNLFPRPPGVLSEGSVATATSPNATSSQKDKPPQKVKIVQKDKPQDEAKIPAKKRKRDETLKMEAGPVQPPPESTPLQSQAAPATSNQPEAVVPSGAFSAKKRKLAPFKPAPLTMTTQTIITTVPLAAPAPSPPKPPCRSKSATPEMPETPAAPAMPAPEKPKASITPNANTAPKATATSSRPRRVSLTLKGPAEPPPEPSQASPRTATRAASRRGSTGPPSATLSREYLRRTSATPVPPPSPKPALTAAARRSKRPAPGAVVESSEGGAAVSVGKRQHAPGKAAGVMSNAKRPAENANAKDKETAENAEEEAAGEQIDPDEPRYCYCGDVSYGEMVGCENVDCEREWFHFACVGLTESPGRRTKWYCKTCIEKLGIARM